MIIAKRIFMQLLVLLFVLVISSFFIVLSPASENSSVTDEIIVKNLKVTAIEKDVVPSAGANKNKRPPKSILNTNNRKTALSQQKPLSRAQAEAAGWKTKSVQGPIPVKDLIKEVSEETKARQERLKAKLEKRKLKDMTKRIR